jgi:hypothetical protein
MSKIIKILLFILAIIFSPIIGLIIGIDVIKDLPNKN